jgi:hypothetical protein
VLLRRLLCAEGEAAAGAAGPEPDAALKALLSELEGEAVAVEGEEALLERLGQLDLLLTWLWRVHGLDYYGGRELLLEADYMDRAAAARTLRGPRPEEGEEQDEDEGEPARQLQHSWLGAAGLQVSGHVHSSCGCWVLLHAVREGVFQQSSVWVSWVILGAIRRCTMLLAAEWCCL